MAVQVKKIMGSEKERIIDHPIWAEIDLNRLRENVQVIREHIGYEKEIIAVVKADAYGHGAVQVVEALVKEGIDFFAVASLEEAVDLRHAGIKQNNILVMSSVDPSKANYFFDYDLIPSVFSLSFARTLQYIAEKRNYQLDIHLRVDVASGSFGVFPDEAISLVRHILTLDYLKLQGVYTHLTSAYGIDVEPLEEEVKCFNQIIAGIRQLTPVPVVHAASSPAVIKHAASNLHYVRIGTILYGLPSLSDQGLDVGPVMQLKAKIQDIKTLSAGMIRGYNYQIEAKSDRRIAVVPLGYAHASYLLLHKEGLVLIREQRVNVIGHSYMNHILVDITEMDEVKIGDEVVFIGKQGDQNITAAEVAQKSGIGVTNCESICLLGKNVPLVGI